MKHIVAVFLWVIVAAGLTGCGNPTGPSGVNVQVEGPGGFPAALAGRWRGDRDGWEFVFDAQGQIVSAVLSLGRVAVTPGQAVTVPTRSGGEGHFEPGQWTVHYVPESRQLTVKIAMDHVRIDMAGTILEGTSTDIFTGMVSAKDGVWQAQWTTFSDYTVTEPDGRVQRLATDPTYGETKALTFEKVRVE